MISYNDNKFNHKNIRKKILFFQKSIKLEDLKGYKIGSEDTDFYVIINKNDKKLFQNRLEEFHPP